MRILYVDQTGQLGGGELSLLDLVKYSTHDSQVALFSDGPFRAALQGLGIPVHLLVEKKAIAVSRDSGLGAMLGAGPSLFALYRKLATIARGFDVVYANSQKAFIASTLARNQEQKLIWHLRDMLTADHFNPWMRRAAVFCGNHSANAVIANSHATKDSFEAAGGLPSKTAVVYNGISPEPFDAVQAEEIARVRADLGLTGKFVVGAFGRLSPWKGQHVLIDALATLPEMHALIVGDALFGEDAYAEQLRERASVRGIAGRVHFLGFRREIAQLMKAADVIAHTSEAPEPFGRVIVEAMLALRPVIATRAGGAREIIEHEKTGLLVTPGSSHELAASLDRLGRSPEWASKLAMAGRQSAVARFSVSAMVSAVDRVLLSVTS